jgi:hypothetical protein
MVERQAASGVLPARVVGEPLDGLTVAGPLEALEDHDHRDDERRNRPAAEVGEQIGEELVWEEAEALAMEQGIDRIGPDPGLAELGRAPEDVSLAGRGPE